MQAVGLTRPYKGDKTHEFSSMYLTTRGGKTHNSRLSQKTSPNLLYRGARDCSLTNSFSIDLARGSNSSRENLFSSQFLKTNFL